MGKAYSLNGFINAALRRSGKTILVEGQSDKIVLHRIEHEKFPEFAGSGTIDHAGMFDEPILRGLGNKDKVLAVQNHIDTLAVSIPKLRNVLATLIDREWDGINFSSFTPDPKWSPPVQHSNRFMTIGHSIENYNFDASYVCEFLKYIFPEHLKPNTLDNIRHHFDAIIVFAAVISLKIHFESTVSRCGGLILPSHISIRGDRIYLNSSFDASYLSRNNNYIGSISNDINAAIDNAWSDLAGTDFVHWLPHGHIGEELLWSAVAVLTNVEPKISNEIAHGYKMERQRFKALWLSNASNDLVPLDNMIRWLYS